MQTIIHNNESSLFAPNHENVFVRVALLFSQEVMLASVMGYMIDSLKNLPDISDKHVVALVKVWLRDEEQQMVKDMNQTLEIIKTLKKKKHKSRDDLVALGKENVFYHHLRKLLEAELKVNLEKKITRDPILPLFFSELPLACGLVEEHHETPHENSALVRMYRDCILDADDTAFLLHPFSAFRTALSNGNSNGTISGDGIFFRLCSFRLPMSLDVNKYMLVRSELHQQLNGWSEAWGKFRTYVKTSGCSDIKSPELKEKILTELLPTMQQWEQALKDNIFMKQVYQQEVKPAAVGIDVVVAPIITFLQLQHSMGLLKDEHYDLLSALVKKWMSPQQVYPFLMLRFDEWGAETLKKNYKQMKTSRPDIENLKLTDNYE